MMLAAEAAQALAVASRVLALWLDVVGVPHMVAVAAAMGVCNARRGRGVGNLVVLAAGHEQLSPLTGLAFIAVHQACGVSTGLALGSASAGSSMVRSRDRGHRRRRRSRWPGPWA